MRRKHPSISARFVYFLNWLRLIGSWGRSFSIWLVVASFKQHVHTQSRVTESVRFHSRALFYNQLHMCYLNKQRAKTAHFSPPAARQTCGLACHWLRHNFCVKLLLTHKIFAHSCQGNKVILSLIAWLSSLFHHSETPFCHRACLQGFYNVRWN